MTQTGKFQIPGAESLNNHDQQITKVSSELQIHKVEYGIGGTVILLIRGIWMI